MFALQAEALLKLLRHEEAYTTYQKGPNFSIDLCINFFGMAYSAYLLMIGSHVYLAAGRLVSLNYLIKDSLKQIKSLIKDAY